MKKIYFLFAIAAIVIAPSCNNETSGNKELKEMKNDGTEMNNMKMDSTNMDSTMNQQQMDSMIKK